MADGSVKVSLGELIAISIRLVRDHFLALLAYIAPLTVIGALLDTMSSGGTAIANIATFIAGYFLYEHLLRKEGLVAPGRTGRDIGAYLGVTILTGIAIVLGLIQLIVPGLILMARWSIATGIVIAEGQSVTAAMRSSWDATRASRWTIVLLYVIFGLVAFVPAIVLGAALGFFAPTETDTSFGGGVLLNLLAQTMGAGSFVIGVAIMHGVRSGIEELESVFA